MAKQFTLNWSPGASVSSQIVRYRPKGTSTWYSNTNITAANPQGALVTSATVANLSTNVLYEFQIESICSTGTAVSPIVEGIIYAAPAVTTVVNGTTVSVNTNPIASVAAVNYRLVTLNAVVAYSASGTGLSPSVSFTNVASATYTLQAQLATVVNGNTVYSTDPSQQNAWYNLGTVNV